MGWHWGNLTRESSSFGSTEAGALASHVFDAESTQHVFDRNDGLFDELWWRGADAPQVDPLLPVPTTLRAAGDPVSHVFDPFDSGSTQHLFYRTRDGEIVELWWSGGEPLHPRSLTSRSGEPASAVGDPASHVFGTDGTQHVFYRTFDGELMELWWTGGADGDPRARSLNQRDTAPLAAGNPASHVFAAGGPPTQHLFYRATDGAIWELFWRTSDEPPQLRNLTELSRGALLAASDPVSHVFNHEGTQHVFYTADNGEIVELWWPGGSTGIPQFENLTERVGGGPVASGRLASHVFEREGTQHVFFRTSSFSQQSPDPAIVELCAVNVGPQADVGAKRRQHGDVPITPYLWHAVEARARNRTRLVGRDPDGPTGRPARASTAIASWSRPLQSRNARGRGDFADDRFHA
jgi:hypothetical protein